MDFRHIALMQHLSCTYDDIERGCAHRYDVDFCDYLVLTDAEAEERLDDYLDDLIDDVVLAEVEGALQNYFDRDAFKRDARLDGRGHHLSAFDGCEAEAVVDGTTYYIYRTH